MPVVVVGGSGGLANILAKLYISKVKRVKKDMMEDLIAGVLTYKTQRGVRISL